MTTTKVNSSGQERLIFALDVGSGFEDAVKLVDTLAPHIGLFKVGKESFTLYGHKIIDTILQRGGKIFLDLKFHDIPNTVAAAAAAAVQMGVAMFNVHALGGRAMIAAAATATAKTAQTCDIKKPILLAVTVLTSLDDKDIKELGFRYSLSELVVRLAAMAKAEGADGVVASGTDIDAIRQACGKDFLIVTPGVRDSTQVVAGDDQKRVLTPFEAIAKGADYLVVGRPIRQATSPIDKATEIVREIEACLLK